MTLDECMAYKTNILAGTDGPREKRRRLNFGVGDQLDLRVDLGFLESFYHFFGELITRILGLTHFINREI